MSVRFLPLVVAIVCSVATAQAQPALRARLLGSGFTRPVALVVDPVVPGVLHLVQQGGRVTTFVNGVPRPTPFLDLTAVVSTGGEQGLLGMAFPPDAATTGRVFVNFTDTAGNTVVARFTRSAADPLVANPTSRKNLRWPAAGGGRQDYITQPYANHNGGHLAFGPDGYLYIGLGDGGLGDDPMNNAQNGTTLLGKMLRINVAVLDNNDNGYAIPPDNPTVVGGSRLPAGTLDEIWSFGLRNPWRYNFDDFGPGATGALVIADVGQGAREEIDYEPAGRSQNNYGWPVFEGTANLNPNGHTLAYQPVTAPTFEYDHGVGQVITGGYVYRGTALGAAFQGRYFYADCGSGRVWSVGFEIGDMGDALATGNRDHTTELGGPFRCITSFARDNSGELYFLDFDGRQPNGTGRVFRIEVATPSVPDVPTNFTGTVTGNSVTLTWAPPAGGAAPTGYVLQAGVTPGGTQVGSFSTAGTGLFFSGVPDGRYYVRVRAANAVGAGPATSDVILNVGCAAPPAVPTTFNTGVTGRTVSLNWGVAPGTRTTLLEVGYGLGLTSFTWSFAAPTAGLSVNAPPGTYVTRIRAVNACGQSGPSVERVIVVQ